MYGVWFASPLGDGIAAAAGAQASAGRPLALRITADPLALDGEAFLDIAIRSGGDAVRSLRVAFADTLLLDPALLDIAGLAAGGYELSVTALDAAAAPIPGGARSLTFEIAAPAAIVLEAEAATVVDVGPVTANRSSVTLAVGPGSPDFEGRVRAGAVGGAYVDYGSNPGDGAVFSVSAAAPGLYAVTFRYANGGTGDRPLDLSVNGAAPVSVSFPRTPGADPWAAWSEVTVTVRLAAGVNTLGLVIPAGRSSGPNLDQAVVRPLVLELGEPPSAPALAGGTVAENAAGAVIGQLSAVDPEGGPVTFSTSDARFEITAGGALKLRDGVALDFEAARSVTVAVTATDAGGLAASGAVAVAVADVSETVVQTIVVRAAGTGGTGPGEAPAFTLRVDGAVIGGAAITNPVSNAVWRTVKTYADYVFTFERAFSASTVEIVYANDGVNADGVERNLYVDYIVSGGRTYQSETAGLYQHAGGVTSRNIPREDLTWNGLLRFSGLVVEGNRPPTAPVLAPATVSENAAGAVVGQLSAVDPEGDPVVFTTADARFEITAGGALKLRDGVALDFEAAQSVTVAVTAADPQGVSAVRSLTVTVLDANDAPAALALAGAGVAEAIPGAVVGQLSAVDQDGDAVVFSTDDARFEITAGGALKLRDGVALDFEAGPATAVAVTATDARGAAAAATLTVAILAVNEAPTGIAVAGASVAENAPGATVGLLSAADPEGGAVTFSTIDPRFEITAVGALKLRAGIALNHESGGGVAQVAVDATDAQGLRRTQVLDVTVTDVAESAAPQARIAVQSLDAAYFDDRLHFSYIDNVTDPNGRPVPLRHNKDAGVVRITNAGTDALDLDGATVTGPFRLATPGVLTGVSLAPGASLDLTVLFDRAAYVAPTGSRSVLDGISTTFEGALTLTSNAVNAAAGRVELAGFWQALSENGLEPNLNEIFRVFGFGNNISGLSLKGAGQLSVLSRHDLYEMGDETEVLSPYWRIADGYASARMTAIVAYHGPTNGGVMGIHAPGDLGNVNAANRANFWSHALTDSQQVLPNHSSGVGFGTREFTNATVPDAWAGADSFGFRVEGISTDPRLNSTGDVLVGVNGALYTKINATQARDAAGVTYAIASLNLMQQGHFLRMFQAVDKNGAVIPNVFIGTQDYVGLNYDYNDNIFVVEGVEPIGFGRTLDIRGLDAGAADARLAFTSIDNPNTSAASAAIGGQVFRNEATLTLENDGHLATTLSSITLDGADAGAFQIVGPVPTVIEAGQSVQLTVRFVGTDPGIDGAATPREASLVIVSNGYGAATRVVTLSGLAQDRSEMGEEPTLGQIVEAFGYATDTGGAALDAGGLVQAVGDEALMPQLARLDPTKPVEIIQLASFIQQTHVARVGWHAVTNGKTTALIAQDDQQGQTLSPDGLRTGAGDTGSVARASFSPTGGFGLRMSVDGRPAFGAWTDPEANEIDPGYGGLVADGFGHQFRFFEARDSAGAAITGTYIAAADYPGTGAYDYNDVVLLVRNVRPHALTAAEDAGRDGIVDTLQTDANANGRADFFDW